MACSRPVTPSVQPIIARANTTIACFSQVSPSGSRPGSSSFQGQVGFNSFQASKPQSPLASLKEISFAQRPTSQVSFDRQNRHSQEAEVRAAAAVDSSILKVSPPASPSKRPSVQLPRPQLILPVPARCRNPGPDGTRWQMPGCQDSSPPAMLPAAVAVPPGLPTRKAPTGRAARPIPARLQQLDDQTTMPKEVYNRMLTIGDQARGALGYGQHRLAFVGPGGVPVLRRVVTPVSVIIR